MSDKPGNTTYRNVILHGDCTEVMSRMPDHSVDFILTDPPYVSRYKDRSGRRVANDDNGRWLEPSFAEMYRLLKPDSFAISFYGWPKIDVFMAAWKMAGFRIGGRIIFRKGYASKAAFLEYRHEAAYLLIKGSPAFPAAPLADVMDWTYSGTKYHPTQKSVYVPTPSRFPHETLITNSFA